MLPFFNRREFKIKDKKTGNNIYVKQESFRTENNEYEIEGVSTSVFIEFNPFSFSNVFNPFSDFSLPFSKFLSPHNRLKELEDKTSN